jgi:pimeloyl-ACP methyl ester carboxylesterase
MNSPEASTQPAKGQRPTITGGANGTVRSASRRPTVREGKGAASGGHGTRVAGLPGTEPAMTTKGPTATITADPMDDEPDRPRTDSSADRRRGRHPGRIAILACAVGLTVALVLPFAPLVPATESGVTGAVLCGLAVGWLLLGLLSTRSTDERQDWAFFAAAFFAVSGVLLLTLGAPAHRVLDWVWPPALLAIGVWMFAAVRRQRALLSRGVLYPVAVLLVLASVGGGVETAAEAVDAQAHPAPGRLIDVSGHRLHLRCTGTGAPTVVLEAGGGEMSSNLGLVTAAVAPTTRICTYDRAGRGWSDSAATPPSGAQIAVDLHTLLQRGGVRGPYVLAGHSFGGLYVRTFAARYPSEVAGMVLVDSTAANASAEGLGSAAGPVHRGAALLSIPARFGLARVFDAVTADDLPEPFNSEVLANGATARSFESSLDEYADAGAAAREAAALMSLGGKPLFVLSAGAGNPPSWFAAQKRVAATLSTDGVHRTVPDVDHQGLVGDKVGAAATTRAILDVVTAVRNAQPLARG